MECQFIRPAAAGTTGFPNELSTHSPELSELLVPHRPLPSPRYVVVAFTSLDQVEARGKTKKRYLERGAIKHASHTVPLLSFIRYRGNYLKT
jgi:hypothetical protein